LSTNCWHRLAARTEGQEPGAGRAARSKLRLAPSTALLYHCSELARESPMKILETKTAPNPRRVRIFLAEKGIEVPYAELDILKQLKTPEFTRVNPFQRVPVLILDDGTAIAETIAICRYFEELQPEPALFGKGAKHRAMVEMWNRRMELGLLAAVAQ